MTPTQLAQWINLVALAMEIALPVAQGLLALFKQQGATDADLNMVLEGAVQVSRQRLRESLAMSQPG